MTVRDVTEHVAQARRFESEADLPGADRDALLLEAAGEWHLAGDVDRAERLYQRVAAGHGPESAVGRALYAGFLFDLGRSERARSLLDELWSARPEDPGAYECAAEVLEEAGDLSAALRWANAGIARCYGPLEELDSEEALGDLALLDLLTVRSQVREALDQPPDDWDGVAVLARESLADRFQELAWAEERRHPVERVAVVYWPREEFTALLRRWPESYPGHTTSDDPHRAHRHEVEAALRRASSNSSLRLAVGSVDDYADFVADNDLDPAAPMTRAWYAADLARRDRTTAWPPGRNDPCWCGSARKYKKCCGATDFAP
ncbi:Tetratricopeptide repeat-containing protein [Streptoalloteichus tenebrarius]|uniref:Tetratricopeptide repeat-containing protein n=1 Tax=Streptoalloteichus tenebrarius (strain ATCC 17920 / DSM 40477 / JCM 4838 / CBS 697.72 / NBRC 16177 / NCIMB 11028 / NRRL B-12390 / A12253. 1 / ISP 5477) TaxID=1933 RepID=A0ABT1HVI6_STRSD|nr:SEC-C metal-binding domain-containing protein [Streptoalloteichus tenebrarius]MCP2259547.1 Tetratricopeptide repeat-containing protein [Streptoalloteichus tenebrarius]BFF01370.1 SEC-C domain-containing protein [Streptoalloteichus tenebrarius]